MLKIWVHVLYKSSIQDTTCAECLVNKIGNLYRTCTQIFNTFWWGPLWSCQLFIDKDRLPREANARILNRFMDYGKRDVSKCLACKCLVCKRLFSKWGSQLPLCEACEFRRTTAVRVGKLPLYETTFYFREQH